MKRLAVLLGVMLLVHPGVLQAQRASAGNTVSELSGQVVVKVTEGTGSPFGGLATVSLRSQDMSTNLTHQTGDDGRTLFDGLPAGQYLVEVSAPGYRTVREQAIIGATRPIENISVAMMPDTGDAISRTPTGASPKALKETEKGLHSLQIGNLDEAQEHLKRALELSASFPDANYLMGVVYLRRNDSGKARGYLQKAVELAPRHPAALLALGEAEYLQRDYTQAVASLEQSANLRPTAWRAHWLAGMAYYQLRDYEQARDHAQTAVASGQDRTGGSRLLLGEAQAALHEREAAIATLEQFVREQPRNPQVAIAQQVLARVRANQSPFPSKTETVSITAKSSTTGGGDSQPDANSNELAAMDLPPLPSISPVTETNWAPPDVDEEKPVVDANAGCQLDQVTQAAGERVRELVQNVDRFTATEDMEHINLSPLGVQVSRETRRFNYLVEIRPLGSHELDVEEYRNGSVSVAQFPAHIGTIGLPTLVLVFHPYYQEKYEFACEGQGLWRGKRVWVVHFHQKTDRTSEMLVYRVGGKSFPVGLKGRAWIDQGSSQILAMESDIMRPVAEIRLLRDHQLIEYGPVDFRNATTHLWLPKSADWYCSLLGQRYHRRHTFSQFLLFSVDDAQKISKPKEAKTNETGEKTPPPL